MVSSLVVIFAVVELLILPFLAQAFLSDKPMVAGAWMGLAVKTDGAAGASGAITESLILSAAAAKGEANTFRGIFFAMTFFTIGVMANFRKLWEEGIGRLAAVYLLCLFGFIIWVGLAISFIFFAGVMPSLAAD